MNRILPLLLALALLCLFSCDSTPAEPAEPALDDMYEIIDYCALPAQTESLEATLSFANCAIVATVESVGDGYLNGIKLKNPISKKQLELEAFSAWHNVTVNVEHIYYNRQSDILPFDVGDSLVLTLGGGAFGKYYVTSGTPRLLEGHTYFIPLGIEKYDIREILAIPVINDCAEIADGKVTALRWEIFDDCPTRAELDAKIADILS